jgi:hypothetical protein
MPNQLVEQQIILRKLLQKNPGRKKGTGCFNHLGSIPRSLLRLDFSSLWDFDTPLLAAGFFISRIVDCRNSVTEEIHATSRSHPR